jgi:MFS family permease
MKAKLGARVWTALIMFGLFGQIAWTIENMYFNVFLYKTVTHDTTVTAIMVAASAAVAMLTTLLIGALSDKLGKRRVFIVAGYFVWGLTIAAFAFVSKENMEKLFPTLGAVATTSAAVVVLDCIMTFFGSTANDACFNAWVTDVTVPQNRGRAQGVLSALPLLATLLVFGVLDGFTQKGDWKSFFFIVGGLVIFGSLCGLFLIKESPELKPAKAKYISTLVYGFNPSVIKANSLLYILLCVIGVAAIASQVFMPYLMIYIEYTLEIKDYVIPLGVVLILAALASVLGGRLVDKLGKHRFLLPAGIVFAAGLALMYLHGKLSPQMQPGLRLALLIAAGAVLMGASLLFVAVVNAAVLDLIPQEKKGHFMGIRMFFAVLLPMVIGPFLGSAIIESQPTYKDEYGEDVHVPNPEIFLGAALVMVLGIPLLVLAVNMLKKRLPNARLYTRWGKELNRNNPLPEYPRPQLERDSFLSLNGVWEYAIADAEPEQYDGEIVVPFSPECLLSGVERIVTPRDTLYYKRVFSVGEDFLKEHSVLHFGAVDCDCRVYLNGTELGGHSGGFLPFSFDITGILRAGENEIRLSVTDPTDSSWVSRGKQSSKPGGIWYTPQSGIWQTVWLESMPKEHISSIKIVPDIDRGVVLITPSCSGGEIKIRVTDGDREIAGAAAQNAVECELAIPDAKLWSPEEPFLYSLELSCGEDRVKSYFGMRKFSLGQDENGVPRLCLNNKPYFHNGLLDQGYWSDGLLTAPSDEAMVFDIESMKALGFNMLRKHIKIEPLRWYYHCDRLGMLVWQDMVNGGRTYSFDIIGALPFIGKVLTDGEESYARFGRQDAEGREAYRSELAAMLEHLQNCTSIAMWVPFNEAWGQFDANAAAEYCKQTDPTRTVDHASGWHDQGGGDVVSLHIYFKKLPCPKFIDGKWSIEKPASGYEGSLAQGEQPRALVLSEFGGYSYQVRGHVYNPHRAFGYKKYKSLDKLLRALDELYGEQLQPMIDAGLSAAVYTQVSDVEDEINGLLTFDREFNKRGAAKSRSQFRGRATPAGTSR